MGCGSCGSGSPAKRATYVVTNTTLNTTTNYQSIYQAQAEIIHARQRGETAVIRTVYR